MRRMRRRGRKKSQPKRKFHTGGWTGSPIGHNEPHDCDCYIECLATSGTNPGCWQEWGTGCYFSAAANNWYGFEPGDTIYVGPLCGGTTITPGVDPYAGSGMMDKSQRRRYGPNPQGGRTQYKQGGKANIKNRHSFTRKQHGKKGSKRDLDKGW